MSDNLYHYKDSGLDYIYLRGPGVVRETTPYGEGVAIVDADTLHTVIARLVVTSPRPICGQEVRFLRSVMKLSQTAFARAVGVDRSTVARWESEPRTPISDVAASAIRLLYAGHQDATSVMKEVVELLQAEDDAIHSEPVVTINFDDGWHRAA